MRLLSTMALTLLVLAAASCLILPARAADGDVRLVLCAVEENHTCLAPLCSEEMGTITLDDEGPFTACLSEPLSTGSHSITYNPAPGFMFLNWYVDSGFEGACQFSDVHSQSTTLIIADDCQAGVVYGSTHKAVGGVVMPMSTLAIVSPWLAVTGLIGCVGAVVVAAKKRGPKRPQ